MPYFYFHQIDWRFPGARTLDGASFVRFIQEGSLKQYIGSPTLRWTNLDLVLGNGFGQVIVISVGGCEPWRYIYLHTL